MFKDLYANVIVALFIVIKNEKLKYSSTGKWINQLQYIHKMEIHSTTWMNINFIVLVKEIRYKMLSAMIPFISHSGIGKTIDTKNRSVFAWCWWYEEVDYKRT